ncbi:hypothetical protein DH2020_041282 [Rehmannia glutinosa]|uniref:Uncharacterized protein n=1 Tax=Rehmannia glutinosa TaxID=99300 RepID=A0ABR0URE0_REHGL
MPSSPPERRHRRLLSLYHSQPPTPRLSFATDASKLDAVDPAAYRCISSVLKKDGQILCVAAANGLVYTGSQGNTVRVWKLPEFTECGQLKTKACMVVALQVSNDRVYAAYADCKIRVWRRSWEGVVKHVRVATVPVAGSFVRNYISGKDKTTKHFGPISSLAINTSDDILYSASLDKTVKVWRISDFKCIETIQAHPDPINAIVLADDGVLYTASDDATYGGALPGHTHAVMCLASVASYVVSGSADSTCRVWVREMDGFHTCIAVLQGHRGPIRCVAAFPNRVAAEESAEEGCTLCTGSLDGVLKVWRVRNTASQTRESSQNARGNCVRKGGVDLFIAQ